MRAGSDLALRSGALETPNREGDKWLQKSNVQSAAEPVTVSFMVYVGLALCATSIKNVPLRLPQNVRGAAQSLPISSAVYVGSAICATTTKNVPLRLSQMARARAFASNAERRAYTPAAFAGLAICVATAKNFPLQTNNPLQMNKGCPKPRRLSVKAKVGAFAPNAKSQAHTPAAFATPATCGTIVAVTG